MIGRTARYSNHRSTSTMALTDTVFHRPNTTFTGLERSTTAEKATTQNPTDLGTQTRRFLIRRTRISENTPEVITSSLAPM